MKESDCWFILKIFYCFIAGGGFAIYVIFGMGVYFDDVLFGKIHMYTGSAVAFLAFWSYYKACVTNPGSLSKGNINAYMDLYPPDGVMYAKKKRCKTCKLSKFS